MSSQRLKAIQILDWYDGLVLAVVQIGGRPGIFLASLLAWAQAERRRVFALIPLTDAQAEALKAMADWDGLKAHLRSIAAEVSEDMLLILLDDKSDEIVAEVSVRSVEVQPDLIGDIESALSPNRQRWIDIV